MTLNHTLPFTDYLNDAAFGSSDLKAFKVGPPALAKWRREHRDEQADTSATGIGKAAHCAILTPDLFAAGFVVKPEGMEFRSKENKALRDSWLAEGRTILTQEEWAQVDAVVRAFHGKRGASESLAASVARECSVFWTCSHSGLPCKGRPDWFTDDAVYDLKVSIDAEKSFESLQHRIHSNGWLNQLAHNRAGLNANGFKINKGRLVVIAPNPPQSLRVWLLEVREADLDFLEMDNENTRAGIAACIRAGHWPDTPSQWTAIELPASAAFTESDLEGALEVHSE